MFIQKWKANGAVENTRTKFESMFIVASSALYPESGIIYNAQKPFKRHADFLSRYR